MTTLVDGSSAPVGTASVPPSATDTTPERVDVPAQAAGLRLFGAHRGSGYRVPPSLVQRADGQVVQLTALLYTVLDAVDGVRDEVEVAAAVSPRIGRTVVAEDVRTLIDGHLRPLGLIKRADGSEPTVRKANPLLALRFRYVVSDPERTARLTRPFAALFHPMAVAGITLGFAAVAYWVLFRKGLAAAAAEAFASPGMLLAVFAITVASAGFHEFGHAAALRRGGGVPGAMGAGLYMVWPAFYTDVTDSYRLGRAARLRTDLGGLYFNALLALTIFGAWAIVRWDGLLLVIATQILQMIRQLPPLLRFDGYHVLADLTGVPDLYHRIGPTLAGLWPRRRRNSGARALKPWARAVVTLWVLVAVPLLLLTALVMIVTLPRIVGSAAHSLAMQWALLTDRWGHADWAGVGAKILALVAVALPVLGVCYLITRLVRQVVGGTLRRTKGKPVQRTVAAAAAVAVVAGLVWAWWPRGNYRPIQPNERGVVQQAITASDGLPAYLAGRAVSTPALAVASTRASAYPALRTGSRVVETTVWPNGAPLPTPGHPQLAMVLVPREPGQPGWVFPFNRPAPPGPGDNQAMAVATRDGSAVYDVAFALVTATTDTVLNGNEAYAFASCSRCAAVAVSFQVVLVVGDAHVIAPKNISAAVAYNCMSCVTAAIAIQLDVQLPTSPGASTAARLAALWTQIRAFGRHVSSFSLAEIRSRIHRYERQILQILQPLAATSSAGVAAPSPASASSGSTVPGSPALGTSTAGAGRPDPSGSGQGADPPTSAAPSPSETTAPPTSASESGSSPSAPPSDPAASTSP